jgi:hypothetical protein
MGVPPSLRIQLFLQGGSNESWQRILAGPTRLVYSSTSMSMRV